MVFPHSEPEYGASPDGNLVRIASEQRTEPSSFEGAVGFAGVARYSHASGCVRSLPASACVKLGGTAKVFVPWQDAGFIFYSDHFFGGEQHV